MIFPNNNELPRVITIDEAISFFSERKVIFGPCPMCGNDKFSWISPLGSNNVLAFHEYSQFIDASRGQTALVASVISACDNCGYEIKFNAGHIAQWIIDKKNGAL